MLVALLSSQYTRFAALAEAWLAAGATAFGFFKDDQPLAYWPPGQRLLTPSITMPIMYGNQRQGDLHVTGITGAAARNRLKADASLIDYMIQLEQELQSMTADLVTSQDEQLALYRLTHLMRDQVTLTEILQALVNEAMRMVKAQAGFAVFVPNSNRDHEPLLIQYPEHALADDLAWRIYWQANALEGDVRLPEQAGELSIDADIENVLAVPIRVRGSLIAGLGLVNRRGGFDDHAIELAHAIADQASAQIERILLYQETYDQAKLRTEMELARRVQADLLPCSTPSVVGLDIYANSQSAYQVGGDFFDFIDREGRPFIFSVGDVSGKGLPAALLMTMTRTAIHSKAQFMLHPTPEAVLRQSNEELYNDFMRVGVFATVFVGQYEPGSRQLTYANAGHTPVIYKPYDGEPVLLQADSTAIGILPSSHCRNQTLRMYPGDLLITATDGFSDARNHQDEFFSIERFIDLINHLADRPAQSIAEALFEAVARFSDGRMQDDDQTLVVIKGVTCESATY